MATTTHIRGSAFEKLLRTGGLTAFLTLAAFAGGAWSNRPALAATGRENPYHLLDHLSRALVLIENEYVDPVDRERLLEGAIKGMVAELDPHSAYLPARDFAIFQSDTEGRFGGIGVEVDFSGDFVTVIAPIEGSPAERAGVQPGDRILAIDKQTVSGKSPSDLVRTMRGAPGTKVVLTLRREGVDKLLTVTLTREIVSVASVKSKLLSGNVGYFRIKTFQNGTHSELLRAAVEARTQAGGTLDGILLDLRNNPGGLVSEARAVADEFLTGGVIYTTRHRNQVVEEVRAYRSGGFRRGPVVVLVNEYSASAAELVAGALQDHRRAVVVGAPTFGKGSVQTIVDLPGGSGIRLTTMRYYTPGGHAIQAQGIKPDVLVEAAYVKDESFGVLREQDLENALPAEAPVTDVELPAVGDSPAEAGPSGPEATHLGVSREIPDDPTGGPDFALSIGYQIVRGVLGH
jgi:carboxyl-terminal processing protease